MGDAVLAFRDLLGEILFPSAVGDTDRGTVLLLRRGDPVGERDRLYLERAERLFRVTSRSIMNYLSR